MRIIHPRPAAGRQKFIGIEFRDGVAEVESLHPEVEASLFQHGFTVEKSEQIDAPKRKRGRQSPPADPEDPPAQNVAVIVNGHGYVLDAAATVGDLRDFAAIPDNYDLWLSDGITDTKVPADWTPTEGAVIATAPRNINGS